MCSTYPSIGQLRHALKDLTVPTVFEGTVKLHGTNGAVVFTRGDGGWVQSYQSRNQILTADGTDNHGFRATQSASAVWPKYLHALDPPADVDRVIVYGEWCGPKINGKVAVVELEHFFYVFAVKFDDAFQRVPAWKWPHEHRVFSVWDAGVTFTVTIDPADDDHTALEAALLRDTLAVEKACPFATWLAARDGVTLRCTTGEGIVWTAWPYRFKTKGAEHNAGGKVFQAKVERFAPGDMSALVKAVAPDWRLAQMGDGDWSLAAVGAYLYRLNTDIDKEETDTIAQFLADNPLATRKDVTKHIAKRAVTYFKTQ